MKRFSVFLCLFFILFCNVFAKEISSVGISAQGLKLSDDEEGWLCQMVADKLDENLSRYTDIKIVNSTNEQQIITAQRENEDAIDIGKMQNATHFIFLNITKTKSNYIISLKLTDLTTNENVVAITSTGRKDSSRLYSGHGCAVDELTIKLCEALNIELSELEKLIIMEGEENLSFADKNIIYESDIKLYNNKIKSLDAEIAALGKSSDMEDRAKLNALESKKAEAEERLKVAAAKKERAEKEAERRKADELKDKDRSNEQLDKISNMTNSLNEKIAQLRSKRQAEMSLLQKAEIIEMKKKTYLETKASFAEELDKRQNDIEKRKKEEIDAIESKEFRKAELSNGKPTEKALENREKMKEAALKKIEKTDVADMNKFKKEWTTKINNLAKEIKQDYRELEPEKISTLTDSLIITYGSYNGEKGGWPLTVSVQIDDNLLLETTSFLPYEVMTGKKFITEIDPDNPSEFDDFADSVDFYDSLFSQGKQIFTFSLEYSIAPSPRMYPSRYDVTFSNFYVYDTESVKVRGNLITSDPKGKLKLDESVSFKQFHTIYDMRTDSEIAEDERAEALRQQAIADEAARKQKAMEDEEAAKQKKIEDQARKEEMQEIKRQQNEEKARAREEKVSEMKDGIGSFFSDAGDTIMDAIDYHNSNADTSIVSAKFEAAGGGVSGTGFEISYNYGLGEHLYLGTSVDVIFSEKSKYFGITPEINGVVVYDLIEFGYRHSLEDLLFDLFSMTDWDIFSCPNLYYSAGMGWSVCNYSINKNLVAYPETSPGSSGSSSSMGNTMEPVPAVPVAPDTTGSFALGIQIGIETTLLETVTFNSETELNFHFGKQPATGYGATACINFDIGVGFKF